LTQFITAHTRTVESTTATLRGYNAQDRIVYGTGAVVPTGRIRAEAEARLSDPRVAYLHLRSARNNCYQLRIDRASASEQAGPQS
jgi:hypothetical protein